MSRRRLWLTLVVGLVIAATAAAYFLHGGGVEGARQRWEARIDALRAAGEPLDPDDFRGDPVPDADNAEGLLKEVHEAYSAAWPEWPGPAAYPMDYMDHEFSEEELEELAAAWPQLEPLYARLEEASARPVLLATSSDPLGIRLVPWIQDAGRLWMLRARYRPEEAERMAVQNLRTALAWRPRNNIEVFVRWGHFVLATQILRQAVSSGHVALVANGPAIRALLRRAEANWLEDFRLAHRAARATVILEVACSTGHGEPPEATRALYDCEKPSGATEEKQLYLDASAKIDHLGAELAAIRSENDLRNAPAKIDTTGSSAAVFCEWARGGVLRMLLAVRLAHWAVLLEEEQAAGRRLSDDLATYNDRFPAGPPLDPATGRPFLWQRWDDGYLLSIDVDAADPALFQIRSFDPDADVCGALVEAELAWFIRDT